MKTILTLLVRAVVLASTVLAETDARVTVTELPNEYVLANGLMTARVLKRNGDLASLKFKGAEMRLLVDGAITRHSIRGLRYEREVAFDATRRKPGANTLTLTVPAGPVNNGVIYDYLRLELDESTQ